MWPAALNGCLPELQQAWGTLTQLAAAQGIGFSLNDFGGLRTDADTSQILAYRQTDYTQALDTGAIAPDTTINQFRPIAPYGKSYHDYGAAFDVTARGTPNAPDVLGALAPQAGLRWGGNFTNPDPSHFELAVTLTEARLRYQNYLASGGQSDALTVTQQAQVVVNNPWWWALVGVVSYTVYVLYRSGSFHRRGPQHA